jgi:hypothetical protein
MSPILSIRIARKRSGRATDAVSRTAATGGNEKGGKTKGARRKGKRRTDNGFRSKKDGERRKRAVRFSLSSFALFLSPIPNLKPET